MKNASTKHLLADEETQVANEQDHGGTVLSSQSFLRPIKELSLPPVVALEKGTALKEVIGLMQSKKIGSVVVTDKKTLVGIFTERDVLMKVIGKIKNWETTSVGEVMTPNPRSLRAEDEIAYALNNMHVGGYRHIPIVDAKGLPVSMVSIKDVMSWVLDFFPHEIVNLTGEPFRGHRTAEGG